MSTGIRITFGHFKLFLWLQIPQRTRTFTRSLGRTARDCFEYNLRASRRGPLGWRTRASGGRDGSVTECSLPGGRGGQGGEPQSAARVIPQSERDKRLPALGCFHLCCEQTRWPLAPASICVGEPPLPPPETVPEMVPWQKGWRGGMGTDGTSVYFAACYGVTRSSQTNSCGLPAPILPQLLGASSPRRATGPHFVGIKRGKKRNGPHYSQ